MGRRVVGVVLSGSGYGSGCGSVCGSGRGTGRGSGCSSGRGSELASLAQLTWLALAGLPQLA